MGRRRKLNENCKVKEVVFTNPQELLNYIKDTPETNNSHREMAGFCNYSFADALKMLKSGWPEGIKEVDIKAHEILTLTQADQSIYQYAVTGDFLDIGAYLSGQPECFLYESKESIKKEVVKITCNISASCEISQDTIKNKGAAMLALIDKLYQTHFVELDLIIKSHDCMGYDITFKYQVNLKEGYDKDMIAFIICNPAYLRRIYFAICEKITGKNNCRGYGAPRDIEGMEGIYIPALKSGQQWNDYATLEQSANTVSRLLQICKKEGR